jgi:hypothetical protein
VQFVQAGSLSPQGGARVLVYEGLESVEYGLGLSAVFYVAPRMLCGRRGGQVEQLVRALDIDILTVSAGSLGRRIMFAFCFSTLSMANRRFAIPASGR